MDELARILRGSGTGAMVLDQALGLLSRCQCYSIDDLRNIARNADDVRAAARLLQTVADEIERTRH